MEVVRADPKKTFKLEKRIGKGTYGEVWQAHYRASGHAVAIKIIDDIAEALEEVKESRALNRFAQNHPNLPKFMGVYVNSPMDDLVQPQVWIAMELCAGGTVTELSKRCVKLIPCLSSICPDDLLRRYTGTTSTTFAPQQTRSELLNRLIQAHCPCFNHRKARTKSRLEAGIKKKVDMSKATIPIMLLPQNICSFEGGTLPGRLPPIIIQYLMYSTVSALAHLHSYGVIHRDVKGSNILLTEHGEVKLVDFGISCRLKDSLAGRTTIIGTPYWMAPEVIEMDKTEGYGTRADVWSLGVTGLELWEAEPPLAGIPPMKAFSLITHGPHPLSLYPTRLPQDPEEMRKDALVPWLDQMPAEMFDFLSRCLEKDTSRRPSSQELLQHRFIASIAHSLPEAQKHLLSLMRSLSGTNGVIRRFSEPPRLNYARPPRNTSLDCIVEHAPTNSTSFGLETNSSTSATSTGTVLNSSSVSPKGLGQRFTSTVSLNICSLSAANSTTSLNTAGSTTSSTIRSPPSVPHMNGTGKGPQTHSPLPNGGVRKAESPFQQTTLRTAQTGLENSQSTKFGSPMPSTSSAYFSGNSKTASSTIDDIDGAVISASRVAHEVVEVENFEEPDQRSDIDLVSSGEYEREDDTSANLAPSPKEKIDADVRRRKMSVVEGVDSIRIPAFEVEGCVTDVNGVTVYMPISSEYRNLFQSSKTDFGDFVKRLLYRPFEEHNEKVVFVVGRPQTPMLQLCQHILSEAPYLPSSTKEFVNNTFHIAEKLIGPQELSIRGIEFIFSRDFRLVDASTKVYLNPLITPRQMLESFLLQALTSFINPRMTNSSPAKDLSEIASFQLFVMSAGFSPQEIISIYRLLIAVTALRSLRYVPSTKFKYYGCLQPLPEEIYTCAQKRILRGDTSAPHPPSVFTSDDVARLLGVHDQDLRKVIYSKTTWRDPVSRNLASRQFWRYLEIRKRKMFAPPNTPHSQNDSGFFEDYHSGRKRGKREAMQKEPSPVLKLFKRPVRRVRNALGVYHLPRMKFAYVVSQREAPRPNKIAVEALCGRLHSICVSVVFRKLNSLLHSMLNRDTSAGGVLKIKVYNLIPSSTSVVSHALMDLLHAKFLETQKRRNYSSDREQQKLDHFFEHQSQLLLDQLMQSRDSGYASHLNVQEFINGTFPSTQCEPGKFCVMHYHGKEEFLIQNVLPRCNPVQEKRIKSLLRLSNNPLLREMKLDGDLEGPENFLSILSEVMKGNASLHLISVLDDIRSGLLDSQPQQIDFPQLSTPLQSGLTSKRHLKVFQDSGLLNFAAINSVASGVIVLRTDEFIKQFEILSRMPSPTTRNFGSLAARLKRLGKVTTSTTSWKELTSKFHFREYLNTESVTRIMANCGLFNDLYFVSRDYILLNASAHRQLKLELLKHSTSSRRIQRWWRLRRQQRLRLTDISNRLPPPPPSTNNKSAVVLDASRPPAYVVANTVVMPNIATLQNYQQPPSTSPNRQISPSNTSGNHQRRQRRPPPSAGIAWFEPRHHRPPLHPKTAVIEAPATRNLGKSHSSASSTCPTAPDASLGVNLRRSHSARSVEGAQAPPIPPHSEISGQLSGVQRRIRRRTTEVGEFGARRPVSWHVDRVEAQVNAHLEKQRLLNGLGSPPPMPSLFGQRGSIYDHQYQGVRRMNSDNSPSRYSKLHRLPDSSAHSPVVIYSSMSPEAQREEYARLQAEITRGEYRRSREVTASPPRRFSRPSYQSQSPTSVRYHSNSETYTQGADFRVFSPPQPISSSNPQNAIPPRPAFQPSRQRPQTTVFDGPMTPNLVFVRPSPPPQPAYMNSPQGGKVVIPVNNRGASVPGSGVSQSSRTFVVDNRGLKASGCPRSHCYE